MSAGTPERSEVRFFVDEDLTGLGLGLARLRNDLAIAQRPPVQDVPRSIRTG